MRPFGRCGRLLHFTIVTSFVGIAGCGCDTARCSTLAFVHHRLGRLGCLAQEACLRMSLRRTLDLALLTLLALGALAGSGGAQTQDCQNTPEGRVCRIQQPITAGTQVDAETQRGLGLIKISSGCSATLLRRFWVLTARHCVTVDGMVAGLLAPPRSLLVTADWAPDRAGIPSRIHDFAVNATPGSAPSSDIVLLYLGSADLGPVDSQPIYAVGRDQGGGSVILSGRLTTADRVTQYGQGFSTFARGVFGTPSAVPSGGLGIYRSAPFTPSSITSTGYDLVANGASQIGHGGDSGGPTVVTRNGFGVGIAGVQSTCRSTGYIPNTPRASQNWLWATGISACQYVATEPFLREIYTATGESPSVRSTLFERHVDGKIWKYDGRGECSTSACPGWTEIDHNPATRDLVTARFTLFQRHADGRIWKYDGTGQCTVSACPGWTEIDHNPNTVAIAGGNNGLYQLHGDRRIWKYDGEGSCAATACPGWTEIDHNPATRDIVAARGTLFQRHADGRIWKYSGTDKCSVSACPGWTEIDHNQRTAAIAGGADVFYQRHVDGRIWKYDGRGTCTVSACPGWTEIDHNPATRDIVASGSALFQRHADGRIWKYDGRGTCTVSACPGWTEIDHNPATRDIVASGSALFQRHADGRIWKYDGNGQCTASACPGWTEIDHNARTATIVAVEPF
jgi:hypothetical protein